MHSRLKPIAPMSCITRASRPPVVHSEQQAEPVARSVHPPADDDEARGIRLAGIDVLRQHRKAVQRRRLQRSDGRHAFISRLGYAFCRGGSILEGLRFQPQAAEELWPTAARPADGTQPFSRPEQMRARNAQQILADGQVVYVAHADIPVGIA